MIPSNVISAASELVSLIETNAPEDMIGRAAQGLVYELGGCYQISNMTPGAAAVYLIALALRSQP